jgi:hypothetical protein
VRNVLPSTKQDRRAAPVLGLQACMLRFGGVPESWLERRPQATLREHAHDAAGEDSLFEVVYATPTREVGVWSGSPVSWHLQIGDRRGARLFDDVMLVLAALFRADQTYAGCSAEVSHPNVFHAFESIHDFLQLQRHLHKCETDISEEAEAVAYLLNDLSSSEVGKRLHTARPVEFSRISRTECAVHEVSSTMECIHSEATCNRRYGPCDSFL